MGIFIYLIILYVQISAWMVDYGTPGGVDKQGWQYAHDFPR